MTHEADAITHMVSLFGSRFPDDYAEQLATAAIEAKNADLIPRIRDLVGDYVDLSDRRYAQMMKLIERELMAPRMREVANRMRSGS
jgi:hypothetical protein